MHKPNIHKSVIDFTKWMTFEGVVKDIDKIDNQHLSNIIHFMTYMNPSVYDEHIRNVIQKEIDRRYNGLLLPWRPVRRYDAEMKFLEHKGYLVKKEEGEGHHIVINGKWIGEVSEY